MSGLSLSLGRWEKYADEEAKTFDISRSAFVQQCIKYYHDSKKTRKIQIWLIYIIFGLLIFLQVLILFLVNGG